MSNLESNEKINVILKKLELIESKLDNLIEQNKKISKETQRMDSHVTFVEGVYDTVKSPFHFMMNRINNISYLTNSNNNVTPTNLLITSSTSSTKM